MKRASQIDAMAGALRVVQSELLPLEKATDYYAAFELDLALEHLTNAARVLREAETLRLATAFGGGSDA